MSKPFQAPTGGLGLAEAEKPPEVNRALQATIERGIVLKNMTLTPGWKAFEALLGERFVKLQEALENERDFRNVGRIQEQLKELRFVLSYPYSEINAAENAKRTVDEQATNTGDE